MPGWWAFACFSLIPAPFGSALAEKKPLVGKATRYNIGKDNEK